MSESPTTTILGVTSAGIPVSRTRNLNSVTMEVAAAERKAFSTLMKSCHSSEVPYSPATAKAHADATVWAALSTDEHRHHNSRYHHHHHHGKHRSKHSSSSKSSGSGNGGHRGHKHKHSRRVMFQQDEDDEELDSLTNTPTDSCSVSSDGSSSSYQRHKRHHRSRSRSPRSTSKYMVDGSRQIASLQHNLLMDQMRDEIRQQNESRQRMESRMYHDQVQKLCDTVVALDRKIQDEVESVKQHIFQNDQEKKFQTMKAAVKLQETEAKNNQRDAEIQRLHEKYEALKAQTDARDKVVVETVQQLMKDMYQMQEQKIKETQDRLTQKNEVTQLSSQMKTLTEVSQHIRTQLVEMEAGYTELKSKVQLRLTTPPPPPPPPQPDTIATSTSTTSLPQPAEFCADLASTGVQTTATSTMTSSTSPLLPQDKSDKQWAGGGAQRRTYNKLLNSTSGNEDEAAGAEVPLKGSSTMVSTTPFAVDDVVKQVVQALRSSVLPPAALRLQPQNLEDEQPPITPASRASLHTGIEDLEPTSATSVFTEKEDPLNASKAYKMHSLGLGLQKAGIEVTTAEPVSGASTVCTTAINSPRMDHQVAVLQEQINKLQQQKLDLELEEREYLALQQEQRHQQWLRMLDSNAPPPPPRPSPPPHARASPPPQYHHQNMPPPVPYVDNVKPDPPTPATVSTHQPPTVSSFTPQQLPATVAQTQPTIPQPQPEQQHISIHKQEPAQVADVTPQQLANPGQPHTTPVPELLPATVTAQPTPQPAEQSVSLTTENRQLLQRLAAQSNQVAEPVATPTGDPQPDNTPPVKEKKKGNKKKLKDKQQPLTTPEQLPTATNVADPAVESIPQPKKKGKKGAKKKVELAPDAQTTETPTPDQTTAAMVPKPSFLSAPKTLAPLGGGLAPLGAKKPLPSLSPLGGASWL
eukprot:TRINITY_DN103173_c0_g1_i1.p1 TRINITY_DN103173_c0_g1~~TRINITY_DN103173_c0_g1_i1.p1  ORF type:complete len:921 (-),score=130.56 TRINITY_DN103173_c0_g1_i1:98-2860(-)